MIHGWSMHSGIWRSFAQSLAKQYRVVCVDLPGHGWSKSIAPYTLEHICDELMKVIPAERFHVLGWSLGATVAMALAERFSERVSALLVVAGNPRFVTTDAWPGVEAQVLQLFAENLTTSCEKTLLRFLALQVNGLDNSKQLLTEIRQAVQECAPPAISVLQGGLEILKHCDLTVSLQNTRCPILFMLGDKDTLIPTQVGEMLTQINPNVVVHVLQNAGHVPFLSHERQMIVIINQFCSQNVPG